MSEFGGHSTQGLHYWQLHRNGHQTIMKDMDAKQVHLVLLPATPSLDIAVPVLGHIGIGAW